jgi:hypothetical protein
VSDPQLLDQTLRGALRIAGLPNPTWNQWPNGLVAQTFYDTSALEVARAYYQHKDLSGMRSALENELAINPADPTARLDLLLLSQRGIK